MSTPTATPEFGELKAARTAALAAAREANAALVKYAYERVAEACAAFTKASEAIRVSDFHSRKDYDKTADMLADILDELGIACGLSSDESGADDADD